MVTALQPLIDATPVLGTLDLQAGVQYSPGKLVRQITLNGHGATALGPGNVIEIPPAAAGSVVRDLTAQGPTQANTACFLVRAPCVLERITAQDSLQYGVRQYHADNVILNGATVRRIATGWEVNGYGNGTVLNDLVIDQVDRIMVDTVAAWGGDGLTMYKTDPAGTVRANRLKVSRARAKTAVAPWPYDGSAIEGYGQTGKLIVDGFEVNDCVNLVEVGTDTATPNSVPTGWELRNGKVNGNTDIAPGWARNCEGLYLRANRGFVMENITFTNIDDFVLTLVAGGTYGGVQGANVFRNNVINIKPGGSGVGYGPNRAYLIGKGMDPKAFGDVYGNRVIFDPSAISDVALMTGKPGTNSVDVFRTQTGWTLTGEEWGLDCDCDALKFQVAQLVGQNAALTQALNTATGLANARLALLVDIRDTANTGIPG